MRAAAPDDLPTVPYDLDDDLLRDVRAAAEAVRFAGGSLPNAGGNRGEFA